MGRALLLVAGLCLGASPVLEAAEAATARQFIPASDARFLYEGRFDFTRRDAPVVVWEGSRISLDFEGAALALRFAGATDQNFFNAAVDGVNTIVAVPAGGAARIELPSAGPGWHRLVLFKRSEAATGQAVFSGIEIAPDAAARAPAAPVYRLRLEFLGDSISAGACNEDGAEDQWADRRTHNNALSYTALTAAAFNADYRCTAVSGMGIAAGWTDVKAGEIWDRVYPKPGSLRADLAGWQPDVLCINLGENDDSFTSRHDQPFPSGYTPAYVALVKTIRAAWPHARIVLLRGGMYGGAKSERLRAGWEAAVKELEATDPLVSHFAFTHWTPHHPRVSDDRVMADELTAWLKQQPFMAPLL